MAAKKKKEDQFPSWFSANRKPDDRYLYKPAEFIEDDVVNDTVTYEHGDNIVLRDTENFKYKLSIDTELDYGGCYYPGDSPSVVVKVEIVEYETKTIPNPSYKYQLKHYNEQLKHIKEWGHWKAIWDSQESKRKEYEERKLLLKLKKKYEKGKD